MVFEICASIATAIFLLVGVYLILLLKSIKKSSQQAQMLLKKLEESIASIELEATKIMRKSSKLTSSLQWQLEQFNPLLRSLFDIGMIFQKATRKLRRNDVLFYSQRRSARQLVSDLLHLAVAGTRMWEQLKKRK